jgi:hypothetical protein
MTLDQWQRIAGLAATQHGIVSAADLAAVGLPVRKVRNYVRTRRLERVAPDVWRIVGAPASWEQRLRVGLSALGPLALVSHEAAAQLHGFDRTPRDRVEFLVPRQHRRSRLAETVHTSARLRQLDRVIVRGFATTSATRTVLDLAMLRPGRHRLEAAIDSAIRSRSSSPVVLVERLTNLRGPGRWGCRLVESLLVDAGGESVLERRFLEIIREAALPRPATQIVINNGHHRIGRVDFVWDDLRVVVEVSGSLGHSSPSERTKDAQRRNELQDDGWKVYEYTYQDVVDRPSAVARSIRSRLIAAGWHP